MALHVLARELPWWRGEARIGADSLGFETVARHGGLSHLVWPAVGADASGAICAWLAGAGSPVVERPESAEGAWTWEAPFRAGPDEWPSAFRPDASAGPRAGGLSISAGSVRALRSGHPWVTKDAETGSCLDFAPGSVVRLVGPGGRAHGLALVDDGQPVSARLWDASAARPREAPSVEARVARAIARRRPLLEAGDTDALRVVHGEADGLPGLAADRLGAVVRVQLSSRCALGIRERFIDALVAQLAPLAVVEVAHLRRRPPGSLECVRLVRGSWPPAGARTDDAKRIAVREGPLAFWVDPGLSEPARSRPGVGFFLDQRASRDRVRRATRPGGRYLNLFAHTGAFSATLLSAGAGRVVSVDLSGPYLRWLEANLELSGLRAAPHESVRLDVRRFLEQDDSRFDGIVLDPPTAAAAGRRFFSSRRELSALVASALVRLSPGGWLLVTRNDRRRRGRLANEVEEAARAAGTGPVRIEPIGAPLDFPRLRGFPEGDPFEGTWVSRIESREDCAPAADS